VVADRPADQARLQILDHLGCHQLANLAPQPLLRLGRRLRQTSWTCLRHAIASRPRRAAWQYQERTFGADRIIIAVGSTPFHPKSIPFEADNVYDSDYVASEPRVPRSLTVVGAGVIGIEYATIYSALDVPVTIVEPRRNFLEFIDREIIEEFIHDLRTRGIQFRLRARVESVEIDAQGWTVSLLSDGRRVRSEMLLYSAGRAGATAGLDLEACGLTPDDRGRVTVDPMTFQTDVAHIYAAGDVIGFPSLASTAMEQGRIAACHAFGALVPPAPKFFPTASMPYRRSRRSVSTKNRHAIRVSPTKSGSPASARRHAATSWVWSPE
jgi:pyruvate/2-oxoglutarate dehydrogenase complex dihydrolipoamide dehydrogenase (E3) component